MPDSRIRGKKRDAVFAAAGFRCEYCQTPIEFTIQPFVVEHTAGAKAASLVPPIRAGSTGRTQSSFL